MSCVGQDAPFGAGEGLNVRSPPVESWRRGLVGASMYGSDENGPDRAAPLEDDDSEGAEEDESNVPAWVRSNLKFEADATQSRVLGCESRRVILNCTRQWGKSTVTAAKAVHQAMTQAGSLTLVASPSARQSGELVGKAETFLRELGVKTKGDGRNEIS